MAAAAARKVPGGDLRRERLVRSIRTRHTTALIGALSRFEEHFGRLLWGHGRPSAALSEAERAWRAVWEDCRQAVLDHGHAQLRALERELTTDNHEEQDHE